MMMSTQGRAHLNTATVILRALHNIDGKENRENTSEIPHVYASVRPKDDDDILHKYIVALSKVLVRKYESLAIAPTHRSAGTLLVMCSYKKTTTDGKNVVDDSIDGREIVSRDCNRGKLPKLDLCATAQYIFGHCTYDAESDRYETEVSIGRHCQIMIGLLKAFHAADKNDRLKDFLQLKQYIFLSCSSKLYQRLLYGNEKLPGVDFSLYRLLVFRVSEHSQASNRSSSDLDLKTRYCDLSLQQQSSIRNMVNLWRISRQVRKEFIQQIDIDVDDNKTRLFYDGPGRIRFQSMLAETVRLVDTNLQSLQAVKCDLFAALRSPAKDPKTLNELCENMNILAHRVSDLTTCLCLFREDFHKILIVHLQWLTQAAKISLRPESYSQKPSILTSTPTGSRFHREQEERRSVLSTNQWAEAAMKYLKYLCQPVAAFRALMPVGAVRAAAKIRGFFHALKLQSFEICDSSQPAPFKMVSIDRFIRGGSQLELGTQSARQEVLEKLIAMIKTQAHEDLGISDHDSSGDGLKTIGASPGSNGHGPRDPVTMLLSLHLLANTVEIPKHEQSIIQDDDKASHEDTESDDDETSDTPSPPQALVNSFYKFYTMLVLSEPCGLVGEVLLRNIPLMNDLDCVAHGRWPATPILPAWIPNWVADQVAAEVYAELDLRVSALERRIAVSEHSVKTE